MVRSAGGARPDAVVHPGDAGYPERLAEVADAPPVLFMRGTVAPPRRRLALVGTRHPEQGFLRRRGSSPRWWPGGCGCRFRGRRGRGPGLSSRRARRGRRDLGLPRLGARRGRHRPGASGAGHPRRRRRSLQRAAAGDPGEPPDVSPPKPAHLRGVRRGGGAARRGAERGDAHRARGARAGPTASSPGRGRCGPRPPGVATSLLLDGVARPVPRAGGCAPGGGALRTPPRRRRGPGEIPLLSAPGRGGVRAALGATRAPGGSGRRIQVSIPGAR